ncbi:hypothetical protein Tco_0145038 [Tanacetum coccineum]
MHQGLQPRMFLQQAKELLYMPRGRRTQIATTDDEPNLYDKLVDLLGIDVVTREVVQACPDRKEKGWKAIYGLIKTIMEYLDQTKKELKIDFNKPLKEQDPPNELNDLANKKRKRTSDSTNHSSLCSSTETEEGLCKELQFSLVDNSKLDDVYLLNRS